MVEYEGKAYERDRRGKYRCPNLCSDPNYPPRSWVSDAGFLKHLAECRGKPEQELVWSPSAAQEKEKFCDCRDCGTTIWTMTSCWRVAPDLIVCLDCWESYFVQGIGFIDCAGLELPIFSLEV